MDIGKQQAKLVMRIVNILLSTGLFVKVTTAYVKDGFMLISYPVSVFEGMLDEGQSATNFCFGDAIPTEETLVSEEIIKQKVDKMVKQVLYNYVAYKRVLIPKLELVDTGKL